ncbi:MAG TPA: hypothetical protein VJU86_02770 [Pyrinomonadaceae bacterium]|nr:hypothetical protein [Pyrinomonadaceae bacterium]
MSSRRVLVLLIGAMLFGATSCASSLFKVKPVVELPPISGDARSVTAGGLIIRALPILSDEETQDLFEANLLVGGLLPVRTELVFESGVPVEIKRARFRLRDGSGREWKLLSPKAAASSIMKANGVFLYNPHSRKTFEQDMIAYGLVTKEPLSDANRRTQGFLFFQTPDKTPVPTNASLVLTIEKLPQPAEIKLN